MVGDFHGSPLPTRSDFLNQGTHLTQLFCNLLQGEGEVLSVVVGSIGLIMDCELHVLNECLQSEYIQNQPMSSVPTHHPHQLRGFTDFQILGQELTQHMITPYGVGDVLSHETFPLAKFENQDFVLNELYNDHWPAHRLWAFG